MKEKTTTDLNGNIEQVDASDKLSNLKNAPLTPTERRKKMTRVELLMGETEEPVEVTFEDISAAAFRIKSGIRRTKCEVGISMKSLSYTVILTPKHPSYGVFLFRRDIILHCCLFLIF